MEKTESQFQQVKSVLRRRPQGRYAAFRESLRIVIPYEWRRFAISLFRSRQVLKTLFLWVSEQFKANRSSQRKNLPRGDFYETLTLLPHISESDVTTILNHAVEKIPSAKPDIICFSIVDWSFRFQRPQQLMSQFAANGHRVFYLSTTKFIRSFSKSKAHAQQIKENLFDVQLAAKWPPDLYRQVVAGRDLEIAIQSLDQLRREFNIRDAISYVMIPSWGRVALRAEQEWGWRVVYDCMDEWENFPGIDPSLLEMERKLVGRCQLLVVTAQRLFDKWSSYQRPMILARNAADFDFYQERLKPNELLKEVPRPIIGYYGAVANWFDVDLLADVAKSRPDYSFVLLGGVFDVDVSRLLDLSNVRMLGQQPYETMPQYLYHFDACVIPFKINPITEATDPVKLYEYLSGGKPVISVNLPELAPYREHLYIAENAQDFAKMIDQALAEDNPNLAEERKQIARRHTWENRYRQIESEVAKGARRASVIVVTYNNLALTRLCLESLIRNTEYPNFEVIVVDNNSSDETQKYLLNLKERHENLKIILNEENLGFAKANNQGIRISSGEYIILLNNDTITPRGWMTGLLKRLEDPKIGIVGPVTNFVGNEARVEVGYRTWAEMEEFAQAQTWSHQDQIADIHMLAMFCVAMRREIFEEVGELDEQFGIGMFEDDDYSIRVRRKGYRVVCAADTFVHHFGQAAFGKLIRTGHYDRLFNENKAKFERKWGVTWEPHKNATLEFEEHRDNRPSEAVY
jgi:GT2 family glycosyltransferase/glycosyltransferase involved in cell wall biosynthesis